MSERRLWWLGVTHRVWTYPGRRYQATAYISVTVAEWYDGECSRSVMGSLRQIILQPLPPVIRAVPLLSAQAAPETLTGCAGSPRFLESLAGPWGGSHWLDWVSALPPAPAKCFPQQTLPKPISGDRTMRRRLLHQYEPYTHPHRGRWVGTVWCARRCFFVSGPPAGDTDTNNGTRGCPSREKTSSAENRVCPYILDYHPPLRQGQERKYLRQALS